MNRLTWRSAMCPPGIRPPQSEEFESGSSPTGHPNRRQALTLIVVAHLPARRQRRATTLHSPPFRREDSAVNSIINLSKVQKEREKLLTPPSPSADALSFVTRREGMRSGFNYWNVELTGSYAADRAMGQALASEYLAFIGAYPTNDNATLLGLIVRDMFDQARDGGSRWSGAHLGFLSGINHMAMAAGARSRAVMPPPSA
jgi:hypothetical protein